MISKMFWYMFQPVACYFGVHDWYKDTSLTRECEYCKRREKFKGMDGLNRPVWEVVE